MLSVEEQMKALAVVARYGHLVDAGEWDSMNLVFTDAATVEWINEQGSVQRSFAEVLQLFRTYKHPSAHHSTNAMIEATTENTIFIRSKGLAVESDGKTWSVSYEDSLVRTPEGWRINHRIVRERPSVAREQRLVSLTGNPDASR